jgi:hypothetical protein
MGLQSLRDEKDQCPNLVWFDLEMRHKERANCADASSGRGTSGSILSLGVDAGLYHYPIKSMARGEAKQRRSPFTIASFERLLDQFAGTVSNTKTRRIQTFIRHNSCTGTTQLNATERWYLPLEIGVAKEGDTS